MQNFSHRLGSVAGVDEEGWKIGDRMILNGLISMFTEATYSPRADYGHADPTHDADVPHIFARVLWDQQAIDGVDGARVVGR